MTNQKLEQRLRELPEISAGRGIWQNRFHEFDVYNHTIQYVEALREMTSDIDLIAAGYLHDIGKPVVAKPKIKDGKREEKAPGLSYHEFDDHEKVGEEMVRKMPSELFNLYLLNQERIAKLVGAHYLPMENIKKMRKTKDYQEFLEQYKQLEVTLNSTGLPKEDVMTMFIADCISKGKSCTDIEELKLAREAILSNGNSDLVIKLYNIQKTMYGGKE
jgi:putative nucleotidyltransferase with HDIG domain